MFALLVCICSPIIRIQCEVSVDAAIDPDFSIACFSLVLSMADPSGRMEPARTKIGIVSMGAGAMIRWPPLTRLFVQKLNQSHPAGR